MCTFVKVLHSRSAIRLALAGLTAALLAGCSASGDPFSNPFQDSARFGGSDSTPTGSVAMAAPVARVTSQPLADPVISTPLAPIRPTYGQTALAVPSHPNPPMRTASAASRGIDGEPTAGIRAEGGVAVTSHGIWNAQGGTPVMVRPGDTAKIIADRYAIPLDVLLRVNGFRAAAEVRPGSHLVIPVYSVANGNQRSERTAPARMALARRPDLESARAREKLHFVKGPAAALTGREKIARAKAEKEALARRHAELEPKGAKALKDARLDREKNARNDQRVARSADSSREKSLKTLARNDPRARSEPVKNPLERKSEQQKTARIANKSIVDSTATGSLPPPQKQLTSTSLAQDAVKPEFRWPARGRIIEGFKAGTNDGINIAVPDGTTVKAAEDGVVAYAGDELKGYGNLVLIRHPDGFVTAYANNGELEVKRGQTVKRGQAIAKSGQSGNVSSPQLHFELRKGQTPVDPTRYLAGL